MNTCDERGVTASDAKRVGVRMWVDGMRGRDDKSMVASTI